MMQYHIVDFFSIIDIDYITVNRNCTYIRRLTSTFRIKYCFIKYQCVFTVFFNYS